MRWKIFQWMKLLFRHSSNSRKLSRQKFHNEHACVFSAHYVSKNADWNQQQLTDGGILANRNSANHPYCFLPNQKKVQILAFTCDPTKKSIMPSSRERRKGLIGRGHDLRLAAGRTMWQQLWQRTQRTRTWKLGPPCWKLTNGRAIAFCFLVKTNAADPRSVFTWLT